MWQGELRCANNGPNGEWVLVAELQNKEIQINTPIGEVLTTIAPIGGQWNFICNPDDDYPVYTFSGFWALGFRTITSPSWSVDPTVCLVPEFNGLGMGIRFYNESGGIVPCGRASNQTSNRIFTIANGSVTTKSYSGVFAEIVRVGTIPPGTYSLPTYRLYSFGWETDYSSGRDHRWSMEFVNGGTFDVAACFMFGHNHTIDFGERTKGTEVYTKPFDIWLMGCDGQDLIDFKASAKLSFASSRINWVGTELANCDDTDCANGAYITFTDLEGDDVNLIRGYYFSEQASNPAHKISFNANLHTENSTPGKIDTSLTIVVEYL